MLRTISRAVSRFISRVDPFDNIGLAFSPLKRALNVACFPARRTTMLALTMLALAFLPAQAMPVWDVNGAIRYWHAHPQSMPALLGGAAVIGATDQPQKYPFRQGTVRRRIPIGTFTIVPGGSIPAIQIPQVGMLSRILVDVEGTYTKANATGLNLLDGYDAILARAQVMLNNGSANVIDVSGIGVNIVNRDLSPALPIKRGLLTTAAAQTFSYKFILPVNANQRRQFEMGLLNLQAPELRATLNLSFNPLSSIFATVGDVTLFTSTAAISYEYFEIPDLNTFYLPPLTLVRTIEEAPVAIAGTGDQVYQLPRLGTMIDYHAVLVLNNVYASVLTNLTEWKLKYNISDVQYDVLIGDLETYEAEQYGIGQGPSRTFLFDNALSFNFWAAGDRSWNGGDFRDAIDTEENTTTQSIPTVKAGTSLNASKDNFYHVRRVVQRIVQAPAPAA